MRALILVFLLAAAAASAVAADANFTGTWTGSAKVATPDGQTRDTSVLLVLKHEGAAVTGTAGPAEDRQLPISNGKADGAKLTFAVQAEDVTINFSLTLDGDHLKGDASGTQAGQPLKIALDVSKSK